MSKNSHNLCDVFLKNIKKPSWISQVSSHVFDSTSAVANDPVRSSVCAEESCGKAVTLNIFILSRIKSFFFFFLNK